MINNYEQKQNGMAGVGSNLLYLLVGSGIGAAVALLFAPKPGKELRQDASDAVKQGLETANKTVTHLKETADDYYHKAQEKASQIYQVAFKAVSDGTEEAKDLAGQAKNAAQDLMGEGTSANAEQSAPIFESGKRPFDQRDIKTGIL
ncbi:MAG TPA: YtxH domain-containing protein [Pyrinomonadaceae bacterium]|nr:YtxH domain-containing protein [Pyrinomonadaceae bacterium]